MKKIFKKLTISVIILQLFSLPAQAVTFPILDIANQPLVAGGLNIKPNLLFIFDNSGSMDWSYLPDYVSSIKKCSAGTGWDYCGDNSGSSRNIYPPYFSAQYNLKYYDPNYYYAPPLNYNSVLQNNGTYTNSYPNASPTDIHVNGYYLSTSEVDSRADIVNNYPELYWCDTNTGVNSYPFPGNSHCVRESDEVATQYPTTTFKYPTMNAYWCSNSSDVPLTITYTGGVPTGVTVNNNCTKFSDFGDQNSKKYLRTSTATPAHYYKIANLTWCASVGTYDITNQTFSNCQAQKDATHSVPNFGYGSTTAAVAQVNGIPAQKSTSLAILTGNGNKTSSNSTSTSTITIKYGSTTIATASCSFTTGATSRLPTAAEAQACITNIDSATTLSGWEVTGTPASYTINVIAPPGINPNTATNNTNYNNQNINISVSNTGRGLLSTSTGTGSKTLSGGVNYIAAQPAITTPSSMTKIEITSGKTYPKSVNRVDCTTNTNNCTYTEEIQNFANWLAYYHKRMDTMKTSISRALNTVSDSYPGNGFRIGLNILNTSGAGANEVAIGDFASAKKQYFYTQLFKIKQSGSTPLRTALLRAGLLYAGKKLDYSALSAGDDPVQKSCQPNFTVLTTDGYWNQDYSNTCDGGGSCSVTLKDIDGTTLGDQDGSETGAKKDALAKDVTLADIALYFYKTDLRPAMTNNVATSDGQNQQHMTTFTLGLGLSGFIDYNKDYLSGASSDYNAIVNGTKNWGNPISNTEESRVDDLWHAAVNGGGQYFSASNPADLYNSLSTAISSATAITGSGAAASTSNLEPVTGDNYIYTANYTTNDWYGGLERRTIDLTSGTVSPTADWDAKTILDSDLAGGIASRKIYTLDTSSSNRDKKLVLNWTNVNANTTLKNYFNPAQLTQCGIGLCSGHTNQNLFNYLMGDNAANPNSSYRSRPHILGDIINSQPVYVGKSSFAYNDSGYASFAAGTTSRGKVVYIGSNDGMLHAFDATNGTELWNYIPNNVLPNMYHLAETNYSSNHKHFVDGKTTVADVYDTSLSAWRTILVSGLNNGGKSYFALDITDPANPEVLWEKTNSSIGYSYGNPLVGKLPDGSWVTLLTSGYNNNDTGKLFVVDAITGATKYTVSTGGVNNSGLAKIAARVTDPNKDNSIQAVYGGDLMGNLYKFTLGNSSGTASLVLATGEPITAKPVVSLVESGGQTIPLIAFGTGIFLQENDKNDTATRHIIAVKDDGTTKTNPFAVNGTFVQQTFSTVSGSNGSQRTLTSNTVDWNVKDGWAITLPDSGERIFVEPKVQLGTLVIPSNVPTNVANDCSSGGYSWINNINILTGSFVPTSQNSSNVASQKVANSLTVGINIIRLPNGKIISIATTSDNNHPTQDVYINSGSGSLKRVSWKELIPRK